MASSSIICFNYIIDSNAVINFIEKHDIKRVLVQAPNGLKKLYKCIQRILSSRNLQVYFSSSPTYGGCDLEVYEARLLGVDGIIHIGHNEYPYLVSKPKIPVLYLPAYYNWKPSKEVLEKLVEILDSNGVNKIGLVASIQHLFSLKDVSQYLSNRGYRVFIGESKALLKGQILGCDYTAGLVLENQVDAYLVIAGGKFHALGLALVVNKPVFVLDPYTERIWKADHEAQKILAKRLYVISSLRNKGFRSAGIIIGTKLGQYRPGLVKRLVSLLEGNGIEYVLITSNDLSLSNMINIDNALGLDVYVITSCPRLPIEDLGEFYKPVLTPGELVMVFDRSITSYKYPW
ncbi:MAG: diphthamide biosynthesis enzyme Dph2 [Thermoprotei archaeon]